MKRKIIGHRGAAGLELENTATSLQRAVNLDISAVELDVRLTKDKQLVVCHDSDLQFVADDSRHLASLTLKQIKAVKLIDGSSLLTLGEALKITAGVPTIIEIKDHDCCQLILDELQKFPKDKFIVCSKKLEELIAMRKLAPKMPLYVIEFTKPLESIHFARRHKLQGVALNYWILNPLTYWYARRSKLDVYVYSVNNRPLASFLTWLYPHIALCTDHPELFVRHRQKLAKSRKKAVRTR